MAENIGRELQWDDEILNDSSFELVPEGDYDFKVTGFERGRSKGQGKLPPCNMAVLTIDVKSGEFRTSIKHWAGRQIIFKTSTSGTCAARRFQWTSWPLS